MAKLRRQIAAMETARVTKRAERRRKRQVPVVVDRRLHQRRQVEPAQPADRRRRAGRGRAVRHPRPHGPPGHAPRRAGVHPDRHRRASSGSCRTSWSRRSARPWRRSPTPISSCTSSTASHPDPRGQLAAVRDVLAEVGRRPGARARGDQQGRRRRARGGRPAAPARVADRWSSPPAPARDSGPGRRGGGGPASAATSRSRCVVPYARGDLVHRVAHRRRGAGEPARRGRYLASRAGAPRPGRGAGRVRRRAHPVAPPAHSPGVAPGAQSVSG